MDTSHTGNAGRAALHLHPSDQRIPGTAYCLRLRHSCSLDQGKRKGEIFLGSIFREHSGPVKKWEKLPILFVLFQGVFYFLCFILGTLFIFFVVFKAAFYLLYFVYGTFFSVHQ